MFKKASLFSIYTFLLFSFTLSFSSVQAIPYENISTTLNSPYDGSLKEMNYKGLQTFNDSSKSKINTYDIESITLYNTIYDAMLTYQAKVDITSFGVTTSTVFKTAQTVQNDHPELFYIGSLSASYNSSGIATSLSIKYNYSQDQCKTMVSQLNAKVDEIISSTITSDMSQFQKEIALHDYIVKSITYNVTNYNNNTTTEEDHNVWGGLINNTCVCDGYAESFKLLLSKVGIDSLIVVSASMSHAWNIVNIDGINYQVDTTWDDPVPETNRVSYYYFNLTDSEISDSTHKHTWITQGYPTCTDTKYDYLMNLGPSSSYYQRNGNVVYYFDSNDSNTLYSMSTDGTNAKKISDAIRGYTPEIFANTLYYRNIYNLYVYKANLDGTNNTNLTNYAAYNLYIKNGILHIKTVGYYSTSEEQINVTEKGDLNIDGYIDAKDFDIEAKSYNTKVGEVLFNTILDFNNDTVIDIFDLVMISKKLN